MKTAPARSNVLLLIADDWSPLARCYGNPVIRTPNIDALAERATVFDHAFCTTPSCAASRANVLTGLYAHQHGQYGHSHGVHHFRTHEHLADRTLPGVLGARGVFTGLLGKSHVAPLSVYPFDVQEHGEASSARDLRARTERFLEAAGDRPFFLQVASSFPHRTGGTFDPAHAGEEHCPTDASYEPGEVIVPDWLPDHPRVREDLAAYYTFVSRFDHFVGQVLEALKVRGALETTTLILTSDHGMPFPAAKASPYESGHHCPLLIARPGAAPGRSAALVNWCDLYPTICHALDVDPPPGLPGRSLLPILETPEPAGWDRTFYAHNFHEITNYAPYRVVRERRLKLVHFLAPELPLSLATDLFDSPTWQCVRGENLAHMGRRRTADVLHHDRFELYDLENDPCETTNLAAAPAWAADFERLRGVLTAFREDTGDPWLELDYQRGEIEHRP